MSNPGNTAEYVTDMNEAFWSLGTDRYAPAISTWAVARSILGDVISSRGGNPITLKEEDVESILKASMAAAGTSDFRDDEEFTGTLAASVSRMAELASDPMAELFSRFVGMTDDKIEYRGGE